VRYVAELNVRFVGRVRFRRDPY